MTPIRDLDALIAAGIRFSLHREPGGLVRVQLGDYRTTPIAAAVVCSFDDAVAWLREQVKARFPDSDFSKRLLTN